MSYWNKKGIAEGMCLVLVPTFNAASSLMFYLTYVYHDLP
jgi:hypothetical protein